MCQIIPIETEATLVTGPQVFTYFPTLIYTDKRPEFLDAVREVCDEYVEKAKADQDLNEIYPVYMTGSFYDDPRLAEFSQAVGQAAWDVLSGQGYNMNGLNTFFTEMWCQQHYKHSSMEQHVHGYGSQIVGFYFTQTPEDCSRVVFHDPRAGKVMINLPETDMSMATPASSMINFKPEPGMLIFTNAWLAHSFTRHASTDPIQFIHFNLGVQQAAPVPCCVPAAEII
jgi:uncharacterized protein (TIGR02466 family)